MLSHKKIAPVYSKEDTMIHLSLIHIIPLYAGIFPIMIWAHSWCPSTLNRSKEVADQGLSSWGGCARTNKAVVIFLKTLLLHNVRNQINLWNRKKIQSTLLKGFCVSVACAYWLGRTPKEILNESIILQTLQPSTPLEMSYWEENVSNLLKC